MRTITLFSIALVICCLNSNMLNAQHFIGLHEDEIKVVMKDSHKSFRLNTSTVNPHYKYLKYENKINEITILFFLSEDDHCTLVRKMCDYSNIIDEIKALNKNYKAIDKNSWEYTHGKHTYLITLEEEEWYFTITTRLKN